MLIGLDAGRSVGGDGRTVAAPAAVSRVSLSTRPCRRRRRRRQHKSAFNSVSVRLWRLRTDRSMLRLYVSLNDGEQLQQVRHSQVLLVITPMYKFNFYESYS